MLWFRGICCTSCWQCRAAHSQLCSHMHMWLEFAVAQALIAETGLRNRQDSELLPGGACQQSEVPNVEVLNEIQAVIGTSVKFFFGIWSVALGLEAMNTQLAQLFKGEFRVCGLGFGVWDSCQQAVLMRA